MTRIERPRITTSDLDRDAVEIGELYRKARQSNVDSAAFNLKAGRKLIAKKEALARGRWLPWLQEHAAVLGFETPRTAQLLIKSAIQYEVDFVFDETTAAEFNRGVWNRSRRRAAAAGHASDADRDMETHSNVAEASRGEGADDTAEIAGDRCVTEVKRAVERALLKMRRGNAPKRTVERMFSELADIVADLEREALREWESASRPDHGVTYQRARFDFRIGND